MVLGLIKPLTEMSTRNLPGGKERPARKADNLTVICRPIVSEPYGTPRRYRDSFLVNLSLDQAT
jgi:hypothetical protein